jgi:hypothetical protein
MPVIKKKVSLKKINNNNNNTNKESDNESNSNNGKINFNKILIECVKNKDFSNIKNLNKNNIKKLESEYDDSFDDIISFRKKFTLNDVNNIDVIIYHDENNDGMIGCAIAYHYLKENDKKDIRLIASKPGKFYPKENELKGKNIMIIDINLTKDVLKNILKFSNSLIVIDDHPETLKDKSVFNGINHAACAYTWKFFYPKKEVPKVVQFIDNSDAKLFLKHLPQGYSKFFSDGIGYRYCHNKSPETMVKKRNGELYNELWDLLIETVPNFWFVVGFYYDQVLDNLKEQIAINAVPMDFQGYKVGVLNYLSPALTHPVARQIITNFKKKSIPIDFALLWGYEHINNSYRIQILDDHRQTSIDMSKIARQLGEIGGHQKGGGGHQHIGNFYWPKNDKHDIWDLFTKKFI